MYGKKALIAYGNWSQGKQMKNSMPTLGSGLRKKIHEKFDTVTINEYNTSKTCAECGSKLKNHVTEKKKTIHRLMECEQCEKEGKLKYKSRDKNAALNIMKIAKEWINNKKQLEIFKKPKKTETKNGNKNGYTDECPERHI